MASNLSATAVITDSMAIPVDASHEASLKWINEYGTANYRNSVFFKGPLLDNSFVSANPKI